MVACDARLIGACSEGSEPEKTVPLLGGCAVAPALRLTRRRPGLPGRSESEG